MTERTKTVMMVFGLAHQLNAWLDFGRDMGHMQKEFKHQSGILSNLSMNFIRRFGAQEPEIYEHSVQIAEIFERVARLDEDGIKSMLGLLNKIEKRNEVISR
jgi:hypothetical protein